MSSPHRVEVFVEPNEDYDPTFDPEAHEQRVRDVVFTCTAGPDDPCRVQPDCDCEQFVECDDPDWHVDHEHKESGTHDMEGHRYVSGKECWLQGWFDNDGAVYVGEDSDDFREDCVPAIATRGRIDATFEGDYVEWNWASPFDGGAS